MNNNMYNPILTWTTLCLSGFVIAQPPRGPFVVSPQVLPDKKVTFRYLDSSAKEVRLAGSQFAGGFQIIQ